MATHGKAREITISALRNCEPFKRSGFAMQGIEGAVSSTGRLEGDAKDSYNQAARENNLAYTVLSYATPIAWVTRGGDVIIPDGRYSVTTTHHQSLCRVYLNN